MGRRLVGVGALAAAVSAVVPARALQPTAAGPAEAGAGALGLHWSAPRECPAESYFSTEVARLTLAAREPHVDVDATAWKDTTGRWRIALVTLLGPDRGERIVDADTCALATDAAALVIALMIDPDGVRARTSSAAEPAPPAPPPNEAPEPERRDEERLSVAAVGTFDNGSLPSVAWGLGAVAGLRVFPWRDRPGAVRLRLEVAGMILPEQRAESASDARRGADLQLFAGSARSVFAYGEVVEAGVFAGLELGSLSGAGFGVKAPASASTLWNAALLGAVARFPAHGTVALRGSIELAIPLRRAEFDVGGEVVHRPSALASRGTLAAEIRF